MDIILIYFAYGFDDSMGIPLDIFADVEIVLNFCGNFFDEVIDGSEAGGHEKFKIAKIIKFSMVSFWLGK